MVSTAPAVRPIAGSLSAQRGSRDGGVLGHHLPMTDIAHDCWWLREALAHPEFRGDPAPPPARDLDVDVAIVGGGYTGLWTAWQLVTRRPGIRVAVLERDECGFGPSGRNGGFINGFYDHAGTLRDLFGRDGALAVIEAGARTLAELEAWMTRHGVDAWFRRDGYIGVASSPAQAGGWEEPLETARELGIEDHYRRLSAEELRRYVDSPVFEGGHLVDDGGTVQPARLARGLRRVAMEAGVIVHEHTPVLGTRSGASLELATPGGRVRAGQVVLAINAWAGTTRRFGPLIVPRASYMAITAPALERLAAINWTSGVSVYDYRAALRYLRTTPDGRIALGVGGVRGAWDARIGPQYAYDEQGTQYAVDAIHRFFPSFRDVPIEARWGGPIDVTASHTPFAGTLDGGRIHYALGYTGNGVGPAHLMGKILAAKVLGEETADTRLPIVDMEPRRFPPQPFRSIGAAVVNLATVRRDDALDATGRIDPLTDQLARLPRRMGYHLGP
jgi:glycine/D-amino acid oxidase-like deaminating enzyme